MRASRRTRSGSALNESGPTLRKRRASRSATPPHGSISSTALWRQLSGDRVDRQVAAAQILLERLPHQRRQIDLPVLLVRSHAPGAELLGELEGVTSGAATEFPRQAGDVAIDGQVEVGGLAAEQGVAHGTADEPGTPVPRRDLGERGQRAVLAGRRLAHAGLPSRW